MLAQCHPQKLATEKFGIFDLSLELLAKTWHLHKIGDSFRSRLAWAPL